MPETSTEGGRVQLPPSRHPRFEDVLDDCHVASGRGRRAALLNSVSDHLVALRSIAVALRSSGLLADRIDPDAPEESGAPFGPSVTDGLMAAQILLADNAVGLAERLGEALDRRPPGSIED